MQKYTGCCAHDASMLCYLSYWRRNFTKSIKNKRKRKEKKIRYACSSTLKCCIWWKWCKCLAITRKSELLLVNITSSLFLFSMENANIFLINYIFIAWNQLYIILKKLMPCSRADTRKKAFTSIFLYVLILKNHKKSLHS